METDRQPIGALIDRLAIAIETSPLSPLIFGSLTDFARNIVTDRLATGRLKAKAESYGIIARWPIHTHVQSDVMIAQQFWMRWRETPSDRRYNEPDFRWTNGDEQRTGELARGVTITKADGERLEKAVNRIANKGSGGRPQKYEHAGAGAYAGLILGALGDEELKSHNGGSVGELMKPYYAKLDPQNVPGDDMLDEKGAEVLKVFKRDETPLDEGGR